MLPSEITARLDRIEKKLEEVAKSLNTEPQKRWVDMNTAALELGVHSTTLRRYVTQSLRNPQKSDLRYGVHYRKIASKYQCNLDELEKYFNTKN